MPSAPTVPAAPLERHVAALVAQGESLDDIAHRLGYKDHCGLTKVFERGRLSLWRADEIAVALGLHPTEVWGAGWFQEIVTTEDERDVHRRYE